MADMPSPHAPDGQGDLKDPVEIARMILVVGKNRSGPEAIASILARCDETTWSKVSGVFTRWAEATERGERFPYN